MQKIAILYEASQAVLSTFDVDEVLNHMLATVRDYFHLRSGAILLLDKETNMLRVRAQFGPTQVYFEEGIPYGKGITGNAARLKRPLYSPDVSKDARYINGDESTRSELAIPLVVQDDVVGVLDCQSDRTNAFENEMVDLLTLFATQAAIALQNTDLYAREQRRAAQLEAINRIAKQTTAVLDLEDMLKTLGELLPQSFPVDHVSVFLYDDENRMVLRREEGKLACRLKPGDRLPLHPGYTDAAMNIGQAIVANDISPELGLCEDTKSEILLPLISFAQRIGLLVCSSTRRNAFKASDVQSLESMADIVATAIQNAKYVEQMRMLANLDGLTGIFNRRYFETKIIEKISEATRYSGGLAVLMIDIDHFKQVNDEFGHLLGDEVLRQVSGLLVQALRKVDLLCRFGGEEFAIIAPATTGNNARKFAEKLRRTIENHHFPGVPRAVTISIGVAEFPVHGESRDSLIRAADQALYRAKEQGRNCVVVATSNDSTAVTA